MRINTHHASTSDIATYLARVKRLLTSGDYVFVPRHKNIQALAQYGLTVGIAKDEILGLTSADYYSGPKMDFDRNRPGDIWEFKKDIDGTPFYIKLKIDLIDNNEILKILGFHEDEYA